MKLCASYQVLWWQTVLCFEIRFFAKRQTVSGKHNMTEKTLTTIFIIGQYLAFVAWTVLGILIATQIFKRDFHGLKLSSLYLINSIVFVFAYGLILKLALIVMAPIEQTKEKSIETLRNYADNFFSDFILFTLITTSVLTVLNILYLKYFAKTKLVKHTLILFIADLSILLLASYISTEWYFNGLLQEVYRHFN